MSGQHTQFLDLTNGEGGELSGPNAAESHDEVSAIVMDHHRPHHHNPSATDDSDVVGPDDRARSVAESLVDPSTPGKVVDSGREHTGRWTKEEHEAFLSALQMYGKEWKKVAAKVKTRTVVQTRTHAQKYFQKLQKTMEQTGMEDITHVEMGVSSATKTKKPEKKKPRTTPSVKQNRRSSSTTISAAQVISNLSNPGAASFLSQGSTPMSMPQARHGFSTSAADNDDNTFPTPYSNASGGSWLSGGLGGSSMKIVAPDPRLSMRRGFPEPSPAATGKRKLAEIAAARMLAGVAGSAPVEPAGDDGPPTPPTPPPSAPDESRLNLKDAPMPPLFGGSSTDVGPGGSTERKALSLQIVNPETLGVTYDKQRRHRDGEASPVTPWDGQLEALVSEEKATEKQVPSGDSALASSLGSNGHLPPPPLSGVGEPAIHPVCGPASSFSRSALHQAVCESDVCELRRLLDDVANRSEGVLQRLDDAGYAPIHSACASQMGSTGVEGSSVEVVDMLLSAGADPSQADGKGNTPLHWSARAGDKEVAVKLLLRNSPFDAQNQSGESPLHWAMRSGRRGMGVANVLLESGARPGVLGHSFRRAIDVAADGFLDEPNSLSSLKLKNDQGQKVKKELKRRFRETATDRKEARENFLIHSAYSRTLVLHHPECLEHHPKSATDWEAPDRVNTIMRRVLPSSDSTGATETSGIFPHEITASQEFDRAKLDLLSRVHSTEYLSFVNELSKDLERQLKETDGGEFEDSSFESPPPVVPFTPMVQRSMIKIGDDKVKSGMTSDTSFSVGSLKAARRAAGAVQHAVDCVLVGRNRNAFCVVRPPGHHAGISGLLEGGESCGFCIFNNVAAGALYAISDDRLLCNRCAIVDIDVHHGNGTEEIVRKCHDPSKLFFFSIHLYDNDKRKRAGGQFQYKFYPGTGDADDLALNIINVPIIPLWKEPTPPPPVSNRTHNTRQKTRSSQDSQDDSTSETGTPREGSRASDVGSEGGSITSPRHPSSTASSGRLAYRQAIQSRLLPALRAFNPDLILISAGFDASKGDVGNARHERGRERMGLDLEPEDYAWTTRKILEIADICCQGRVVSVLEGGYGRTPATPQLVPGEGQRLDRTLFAECAVRHLHAMIDPYDTERRFS